MKNVIPDLDQLKGFDKTTGLLPHETVSAHLPSGLAYGALSGPSFAREVALVLARCYREKFGGDHIDDVLAAIDAYKERIGWRR